MHCNCGELCLESEEQLICTHCARGKRLRKTHDACYKRQKIAADKMKTFSEKTFPPLNVSDVVSVKVPDVDKGPLDYPNILGIVASKQNGVYQIGTRHGIIKDWQARTDLGLCKTKLLTLNDVPADTSLALREAATMQSRNGGQGFKKCNCQPAKNHCQTRRCSCFKAKVQCNSRCHFKSSCSNK